MKLALLFSALSFAATLGFAQEHPSVTAQANSVYVGADGKYEAAPDTAQIQMNVATQDNTSQGAYLLASKNVDQIRQILRANGLDPKLATQGFLSVQPVYEWRPKQRVIAYRATVDVTLKLKDFSKVGPITQQLADANVSETQALTYILENMDDAKNHAVEDAYRRARNSAETVARASGRSLGELSYASVDTFENPRIVMPRQVRSMAAMATAAPPPTEEFTPQLVTVTAHVNALFTLK
ncbi:MAG TPA: SIMPL domain-containing protein [Candidatus Dormibacteraeota bacterium]|nr:SIMPL domain-containing protein [Candidatus Dormibacteraeota bacterium]